MTIALSSFSIFNKLAAELRIKIWQYACEPRIVEVRYDIDQDRCISCSRPPAVLQASRESRHEAQRIYQLSFGTRLNAAHIYFNPVHDTLYLPRHRQMGYDETLRDFRNFLVRPEILDCVQFLALDHVDVEVKRPWESYNKITFIQGFPHLARVVLVLCDDPSDGVRKEVEFAEPRQDLEKILRIWVDFRQSFVKEQKMLEEVRREVGKQCPKWSLPSVRVNSKILKREIGNNAA